MPKKRRDISFQELEHRAQYLFRRSYELIAQTERLVAQSIERTRPVSPHPDLLQPGNPGTPNLTKQNNR